MILPRLFLLIRGTLYGSWQRLEPAFTGAWLGLASRELLYGIDEQHYRRAGRYYDPAHNLGGLFDWEQEAVRDWFADRKRITVVGAGAGREVIALARMGHEVDGFECNAALVEAGARLMAGEDGRAKLELLGREQLPGNACDALIMGWSSYMLIPGRNLRVATLRHLHTLLPVDAPLLVSFYSRGGHEPRFQRIARVANRIRNVLRRPEVEVGDDLAPNYVHWFTRAEIEAELEAGGFRMVAFQPQRGGATGSGYAVGLKTIALTIT